MDYYTFGGVQPWVDGTMAYAQSLGIPMWTPEHWLNYNESRAATQISGLSWAPAARELTFTVSVPSGNDALSFMLPKVYDGFALTGVTVNGSAVAVTERVINGRASQFFDVSSGTQTVVAAYTTEFDNPPNAVDDGAITNQGSAVTIPVLANDSDLDNDPLIVSGVTNGTSGSVVVNPDNSITYTPTPGTCGSDSFTYTISDGRGGTDTAAVSVSVVCLTATLTHTTTSDFSTACAVPAGTIVTQSGDGEVQLAGSFEDDYLAASLDLAKWTSGTWSGGTYTPSINGGILSVAGANGAWVRSATTKTVGTLQATAQFTGAPWEHVGWAGLDFADNRYLIFSTFNSTTHLYARSNGGTGEQTTDLGALPSGFHSYQIARTNLSPTSDQISYYIDGVLRVQHTVPTLPALYIYQSHNGGASPALDVDRITVFPDYLASGTFQGCTMDAQQAVTWGAASWVASTPAGTSLQVLTRTSTDASNWSAWSSPLTVSGENISSPAGRYLQYSLELATTSTPSTPVVQSISIGYAGSGIQAPTMSISDATVTEGDSGALNAVFDVTLSAATGNTVTVNYATGGGTATAGSDYTSTNSTLVFPPGATSRTIAVPVLGDALDEPDETFFVNLSGALNATLADSQAQATIIDNEATPSLSINDVTITEGNSGSANAVFTVSLSPASSQVVTVDYASANGTAAAGTDYTGVSGSLTFSSGSTSQTISVPVLGDTLDEPNRTFLMNLSNAANATVADDQGQGTIVDDDATPTMSINDVTMTEGNSGSVDAVFTVSLSAASGQVVTVNYATANGSATVGSDYTGTVGTPTLTFPAGSVNQTIVVPILGDTVDEPNETFVVNLSAAANSIITDSQGQGTIINDDLPSLTIGDVSVTEGNSGGVSAVFTVSLSSVASQVVTVKYATANGTATAGADYTGTSGTPTLTFPIGSTTQTINVPILGDTLNEANETFFVNLSTPVNASIADSQGQGTIIDNDPAPSLAINDVTVTEGNSGSINANFTVTLSVASGQAVTVNYVTANGTATAGADYTGTVGTPTLTFPAGSTSRTITVPVLGDTLDEPNETFVVNLSGAVNATVADAQGQGTITDNDATPSLTINNVTVTEGNTGSVNATFTVALSAASGQIVSVNYATANGTAVAPADYTAQSGTVNFPAGSTSQTVSIAVLGDTLDEVNETFVVNLSAAANATISDSQGLATISDNDPLPSLTINNASVTEGNSGTKTMVFTVTLAPVSGRTVQVNYASQSNTATSSGTLADFVATSGTLTFNPGTTTRTISVQIVGDTRVEANEYLLINLSGASNAGVADSQGIGAILNDD